MNWSVFMHLRVHVIVCRAVCPDNCQLCSYGGWFYWQDCSRWYHQVSRV